MWPEDFEYSSAKLVCGTSDVFLEQRLACTLNEVLSATGVGERGAKVVVCKKMGIKRKRMIEPCE